MNSTAIVTTDCPADIAEMALVEKVRSRDEAACTEFVNRFGPKMLQVATRILRCEQESADAVQDAFVSAIRSIAKFSGKSRLSTWLHRITVNAALMRLRRRRRQLARNRNDISIDALPETHTPVCPRSKSDLDAMELKETVATMHDSIARLPATYRQVIELRDLKLLNIELAAELIGCSPSNVKTRLHRARRALRQDLLLSA